MKYPYLSNNDLVLIDYLPGSSGQLLMRLWAELDIKMQYDNHKVLTPSAINDHISTREIDWDVVIPKKITNWFLDKCEPDCAEDYLNYFEFLATTLVAMSQKWRHGQSGIKFYYDSSYNMSGYRKIYGIHTWDDIIPWELLTSRFNGINHIAIVARTDRGLSYQRERCMLCYPLQGMDWYGWVDSFNSKPAVKTIDLCTMLVDRDIDAILTWLCDELGPDLRDDKLNRARQLVELYIDGIVDPMKDRIMI